jgi:hypothetical protein
VVSFYKIVTINQQFYFSTAYFNKNLDKEWVVFLATATKLHASRSFKNRPTLQHEQLSPGE